jgi:hypothetical protein
MPVVTVERNRQPENQSAMGGTGYEALPTLMRNY